MATQRYISTSFWDDSWVHHLDPSEKFMYMYLLTNPLTNIAGVYQTTIDRMTFDTGYNATTIQHILEKFEKAKKCYFHEGWIILPTWPKHQKWEKRSKIKQGIDSCLRETPKTIREYLKTIGYRYPIDTIYDGIGTLPYGTNYSDLDTDTDTDTDLDAELDIDIESTENINSDTPKQSPMPGYKKTTIDSRLSIIAETWKNHPELPRYVCQTTMTMKQDTVLSINAVMQSYTDDEIIKAIDNYAAIRSTIEPKYQYQSFHNFIANAGAIAKYQEGIKAKPTAKQCECGGDILMGKCVSCGALYDGDGNKLEF